MPEINLMRLSAPSSDSLEIIAQYPVKFDWY